MLICSQNMVNVNYEAKKAMDEAQRLMDVASDEFTEAMHELNDAESYKAESCIQFQYEKHTRSLATAAGEGHEDDVDDDDDEARFQRQFVLSHAEFHVDKRKRENPATTAQGSGAAAAGAAATPALKRRGHAR